MKILGIISYPRSGSSMMGLTLGQYDNSLFIGEISSLFYSGYNRSCTCNHEGKTLMNCPVYSQVLEKLLPIAKRFGYFDENHGIKPDLKSFLLKNAIQQLKNDKAGNELKFLNETLPIVYKIIQEVTSCEIIIDTSKELEYLKIRNNLFDNLYHVHVVRNPLGIIYSARKNPLHSNFSKKGVSLFRSARIGAGWNVKIYLIDKLLKSLDRPSMTVRYEDWCANPKQVNQKIFQLMEEKQNTQIFNPENEFNALRSHVVRGNRSSRDQGYVKINQDATWKKKLDLKYQMIGKIFAFPSNSIYRYW